LAFGLAVNLDARVAAGASDEVAWLGLISLERFRRRGHGGGGNPECQDGEHKCLGKERGDHFEFCVLVETESSVVALW